MNTQYIITQYCDNGKTLREIGREVGFYHQKVKRILNGSGIETFNKRPRRKIVNLECEWCKKPIVRYPSTTKKENFCNHECYHSWMVGNTSGENSSNWKGGITAISSDNLKTSEFRQLKKIVLKNFPLCVMCGDTKYIHVHHIKTRREYPELVFELSNLVSLCRSCHSSIKGKEKLYESYFMRIVSKGGELRGTPNVKDEGNPQPSRSNVIDLVGRKVQRLTGEEITTDKPDTSAAPERDEIVRTCGKP